MDLHEPERGRITYLLTYTSGAPRPRAERHAGHYVLKIKGGSLFLARQPPPRRTGRPGPRRPRASCGRDRPPPPAGALRLLPSQRRSGGLPKLRKLDLGLTQIITQISNAPAAQPSPLRSTAVHCRIPHLQAGQRAYALHDTPASAAATAGVTEALARSRAAPCPPPPPVSSVLRPSPPYSSPDSRVRSVSQSALAYSLLWIPRGTRVQTTRVK